MFRTHMAAQSPSWLPAGWWRRSHARDGRAPARIAVRVGVFAVASLVATSSGAQSRLASDHGLLDSLVSVALTAHPGIRAARLRIEAMQTRIGPAGLRPDPTLTLGLRDFPLSQPGFYDSFTMKMVGISQSIPFPGKLELDRRIASRDVEASEAALRTIRLDVVRDIRTAYFELAFLDRALEIVARNRDVLVDVIKVTEARYGTGQSAQPDVLRARIEAGRLAEQAVMLTEQRRGALASLNAALDRPSDAPLDDAVVPRRIALAAVADSVDRIRFTTPALGARVTGWPFPSVEELQAMALRLSPGLTEQAAAVSVQAARIERARKEHLPDFDVAVEYGQRRGFTDLVTATVSIPLRVQRRARQDQLVVGARADLAALEADIAAARNGMRAEVARLVTELERQRAQLAIYTTAIVPQGRAALTSALASYQVGRVEFLAVLENQATLFSYETEYFRTLSDFAKTLAALERVVGKELLP